VKTRAIDLRTAQLREEAIAKLVAAGFPVDSAPSADPQRTDRKGGERSNVIPFRRRAR
jgi:hypothetical protein